MAPEFGLASLTRFKKSKQAQIQFFHVPSPTTESTWNSNSQMSQEEDDSWEVRAFEEDTTGNLLGCTWPPPFYTCTFCRREFRSAQALGGHMNVHRRDRARLHDVPPVPASPAAAQQTSPALLIQTGQEFVANGLCLLYPLPNPNTIIFPNPPLDFSSPRLPISHFAMNNNPNDTAANKVVSSICHSSSTEPSASNSNENNRGRDENARESAVEEELDLELRLGRRLPPPP